jgi:hypothetical protein
VRIDWAILSNASEVQNNLAYVMGGGWDTGWRPQFPAPFMSSLCIRILLNRTEVPRGHTIEIQFMDEDGQAFAPTVSLGSSPGTIPPDWPMGWDLPMMLAIGLQGLVIPSAGRYSFEILLDGAHQKSIPFRMVLGTGPALIQPPRGNP